MEKTTYSGEEEGVDIKHARTEKNYAELATKRGGEAGISIAI